MSGALFERRVLANHGTCAACVYAMSGVDLALWDLKGKALGGFALGYASPASVAEEAMGQVAAGYRAVKVRLGDTLDHDRGTGRCVAFRARPGRGVAGRRELPVLRR
jgi:D-galactarolactone cycloisomerase